MTVEEKRAALGYLMFLKEKRTGIIKGRGCADGRKQRLYTNKEHSSSPTVSIEAVFITSGIDVLEERDVAIVDVPGAFMQAAMEDIVHMRLDGRMAESLVEMSPATYEKILSIHEWLTGYLCFIEEGAIWNSQGGPTILEEIIITVTKMGLCIKPIRRMCCK